MTNMIRVVLRKRPLVSRFYPGMSTNLSQDNSDLTLDILYIR